MGDQAGHHSQPARVGVLGVLDEQPVNRALFGGRGQQRRRVKTYRGGAGCEREIRVP